MAYGYGRLSSFISCVISLGGTEVSYLGFVYLIGSLWLVEILLRVSHNLNNFFFHFGDSFILVLCLGNEGKNFAVSTSCPNHGHKSIKGTLAHFKINFN